MQHTKDMNFFFLSVAFLLFFPFFVSCLVKDGSFWLVTLTIIMSVFQYKNSNLLRLLLCKDNPEKKKSKSRVLLKAREGGKEGGKGEKWVG